MSRIVLSIVSHGQGYLIRKLLNDLNTFDLNNAILVLTLNIPEDELYISDYNFEIFVIRNHYPKGFGANHNFAFKHTISDFFIILNPDLRILDFNFQELFLIFHDPKIAAVAPLIFDPNSFLQDNARLFPTLSTFIRRVLFRYKKSNDYIFNNNITFVDWVAGMFICFNSNLFETIGGFNESFYMYLEDTDICRRFHQSGCKVAVISSLSVIHDAQRSSFKNFRHLKWHLQSLIRFLFTKY